MALDLIEGWTGGVDYYLKRQLATSTGAEAMDLSGATVTLVLKTAKGSLVATTSTDGGNDVSVVTSTGGRVRYTPDVGDLRAADSPYAARFKVVGSTGDIVFFPNGLPEVLTVRAP